MDADELIKPDHPTTLAGLDSGAPNDEAPADPRALVDQMVAAGDWPDPALLQQIVDTGDVAVEPLFSIVRTVHSKQYDPGPVSHAIGLLSILQPAAAIPELVAVIKQHAEPVLPDAAYALSRFGVPGFDALLDLCRDPSVMAYERCDMYGAITNAAGADPILRSRVAEFMRTSLEELMPKAREERMQNPPDDDDDEIDERSVLFSVYDFDDDSFADDSIDDEEPDDDEDLDDEDLDDEDLDDELSGEESDPNVDALIESEDEADDLAEIACTPDEEIGFLIAELSYVADPLSVDLIETAFREKLVSREIVSKGYVDKKYKAAEEVVEAEDVVEAGAEENWLSNYRFDYEGYLEDAADEALKRSRRSDRFAMPRQNRDDDYPDDETEPSPVTSTIRNTGPKLGRNDPCWCGSGKKYKKCHHGKDAPG
jgi:hypothetical protein